MIKVKKAKKKPVEVEYIHYDGDNQQELYDWSNGIVHLTYETTDTYSFVVNTLEGVMTVNIGDYIVKGVNGEFYPVKPDIFYKTYELVNEEYNNKIVQEENYKELWDSLRKEYFESYKRDISLPMYERSVAEERQKLSFLYMMDILEDTTYLQEFLDEMEDE